MSCNREALCASPTYAQGVGDLLAQILKRAVPLRCLLRVVATIANAAMAIFIYSTYLSGMGDWPATRTAETLKDHLWQGEFDAAEKHLRIFTFSEAMLTQLDVFMWVGIPVSITLFILERDRIRWLQNVAHERMPNNASLRAAWWLELYLWTLTLCFICILLLAPFHIDMPVAHYTVAVGALTLGSTSICIYLNVPIDFDTLVTEHDDHTFRSWATQGQRRVRAVLLFVLCIHGAAFAAAIVKTESPKGGVASLVFGVLETSIVVGYQLFIGVFLVDDMMMGRTQSQGESPGPSLVRGDSRTVDSEVALKQAYVRTF